MANNNEGLTFEQQQAWIDTFIGEKQHQMTEQHQEWLNAFSNKQVLTPEQQAWVDTFNGNSEPAGDLKKFLEAFQD